MVTSPGPGGALPPAETEAADERVAHHLLHQTLTLFDGKPEADGFSAATGQAGGRAPGPSPLFP